MIFIKDIDNVLYLAYYAESAEIFILIEESKNMILIKKWIYFQERIMILE